MTITPVDAERIYSVAVDRINYTCIHGTVVFAHSWVAG